MGAEHLRAELLRRGALLLLLLAAVTIVVFAWYGFPLPGWDSQNFTPAAVRYAAGKGLSNPLFSVVLDPGEDNSWRNYPPLYPLLIGLLIRGPGPRAAFLAVAFVKCLVLLVFALCVREFSRRGWTWVVLCAIPAAVAHLAENEGRPAPVSTLFVVCALWLALRGSQSVPAFSVLLGLTAATEPAVAVFLGLLIGMYFGRQPGSVRALWAWCGGMGVFLFVLILSPIPIASLWAGLTGHASQALAINGRIGDELIATLRSRLSSPLLVPHEALLLSLACCGRYIGRELPPIRSRWIWYGCFLGLFFAIAFFSGRYSTRDYNFYPFLPACCIAALSAVRASKSRLLAGAIAAILMLFALPLWRNLLLFNLFIHKGVRLEESRRVLAETTRGSTDPIAVSFSLWVLSDNYDLLINAGDARYRLPDVLASGPFLARPGVRKGWFALQQNYQPLSVPPSVPGCKLVRNSMKPGPARVAGLTLAASIPGYGFALYRCGAEFPEMM